MPIICQKLITLHSSPSPIHCANYEGLTWAWSGQFDFEIALRCIDCVDLIECIDLINSLLVHLIINVWRLGKVGLFFLWISGWIDHFMDRFDIIFIFGNLFSIYICMSQCLYWPYRRHPETAWHLLTCTFDELLGFLW